MQELIINGMNLGSVKAKRYNRVEAIDGIYNDWYFLMDGGYTVKVEGRNIKLWQSTDTAEEIVTYC